MTRRHRSVGIPLLTCLAALLLDSAPATASTCDDLAQLRLPEATITAAHEVAAGTFTPPDAFPLPDLPAFCRIALRVAPEIDIEVWLPLTWNQRYQAVGNGGYAGVISYAQMAVALRDGYATASNDTGHASDSPAPLLDGSFALAADGSLDYQAIRDFAWRSTREMTLKAKPIIRAFYGTGPSYSYWTGCSTGGREGLMSVQRFPEDYDGVLVGAPAINWDRFIPSNLWPRIAVHEIVGAPALSFSKLLTVTADATAACDSADGVTDGVINDPRSCMYDPVESICQAGGDPASCLTAQEAEAVRQIWKGPQRDTGQRLWFGPERGASLIPLAAETPLSQLNFSYLQYWIMQDPGFDWQSLTTDTFEPVFRTSQWKFHEIIGTDDDNLQGFRLRGGRILMWHGEADDVIPTRGSLNYYDRARSGNGGQTHVDDFFRLFMAPGVGHCSGGPGPNEFGQRGFAQWPQPDAGHDMFRALVRWVEEGIPPDRIIATKYVNDDPAQGVLRTRPLCPFPQTAAWTGTGSTDAAANFACVAGRDDPRDFKVTGLWSK
jgi:Tannase and feruloyl esterase